MKWQKWQNATLHQNKVKLTKKVLAVKEGSFEEFTDELVTEMETFSTHLFIAKWQQSQFVSAKENLPKHTLLTVSDFAENHRLVHQDEIASAYYNYNQATVFPVMTYYWLDGKLQHEAVVVISDDLVHDAFSAKTCADRVEDYLVSKGVQWNHHILYSDGCAAQFKSKTPFHFLKETAASQERAYFGSRHGKSPCDGIGGTVKKAAKDYVRTRRGVIRDAKEMFDFAVSNLTSPQRSFIYVSTSDIKLTRKLSIHPKTIKGTQKIHSIKNGSSGILFSRKLSCFCKNCLLGEEGCSNSSFVDEWETAGKTPKPASAQKTPKPKSHQPPMKKPCSSASQMKMQQTRKPAAELENPQLIAGPMSLCQVRRGRKVLIKNPTKAISETLIEKFPPIVVRSDLSVRGLKANIDATAQNLLPDGIPGEDKVPVDITGDGNCLPRCASLLAFGSQDYHREIRLRIGLDMVINKSLYLNDNYLSLGLPPGKTLTAQNIAQFSDFYCGDNSSQGVASVYDEEMKSIQKDATYMGLWQLFAVSNVLKVPVYSVYPSKGNPAIVSDIHRLILPKETSSSVPAVYIMWTSTRSDMKKGHWLPNHFVVLLPWDIAT